MFICLTSTVLQLRFSLKIQKCKIHSHKSSYSSVLFALLILSYVQHNVLRYTTILHYCLTKLQYTNPPNLRSVYSQQRASQSQQAGFLSSLKTELVAQKEIEALSRDNEVYRPAS
jgi:hypothetical protein